MKNVILISFLLILFGCNEHTSESSELKTYKHSMVGKPNSLDPKRSTNKYSTAVVLSIFDTLYSYKYLKRPYEIKPNLAAKMPDVTDDGLTYVIQIKRGVYFHNDKSFKNGKGREVNASDVVYSIKRNLEKNALTPGSWLWRDFIFGLDDWYKNELGLAGELKGIKAIDNNTIQIKLIKPYPQLLHTLAMGYSGVVPKESIEYYGETFGVNPVGSGPYKFKSFNNEVVVLQKNEAYRNVPINLNFEGYLKSEHEKYGLLKIEGKSLPLIDQLEFHFIEEPSSKWNSFNKSDEIQYSTVPTSYSNKVLESTVPLKLYDEYTKKYHYNFNNELGFAYFGFNLESDEFGVRTDPTENENNKLLRCAIRKAQNWEQRNKAFYFNIGNVFPGAIPPNTFDYDKNISTDSISYNLSEAKKMLAEGNWTTENLPAFEYHAVSSVQNKQIFEQTRGFLIDLGFTNEKVIFKPYASFGSLDKAIKGGKAPFFFLGWSLDYPDAQNSIQLFYGPNSNFGANSFNYKNPKFDELYEKAITMNESIERKEIFSKLNEMVIDDCAFIGSINRTFISMWHKNVTLYLNEDLMGSGFVKYVYVD